MREARARRGIEERGHLEIAMGPELTGEAHIGRRPHALEYPQLLGTRRRKHARISGHANATGGATATPTTHGGVRDAGGPTRLEHRPAEGYHGTLALRIAKPDRLAAARHVLSCAAGEEGHGQQYPGRAKQHGLDLLELGAARGRGQP